nr:hypothetical protein OG999_31385 [Streptomyces sp. NBC_00886]
MARPSPYPAELRERAVRMVAEIRPNYPTKWAAMKAVAAKLGIGAAETVRTWVRTVSAGGHRPAARHHLGGSRGDQASGGRERRTASSERDLEGGVSFLRGRARPAVETLVAFIDEFKKVFGVEPICRVLSDHGLKIATSTRALGARFLAA